MAPTDVLMELNRRGVELQVDGDRLLYRPRAAVDDGLRAALRENKVAILALLVREPMRRKRRSVAAEQPAIQPEGPQAKPQVAIDPVTHAAHPRRVGDFDVPFGWAVASWIDRLRFLARVCIHPGRAAELCEWADGLEQTLKEETP